MVHHEVQLRTNRHDQTDFQVLQERVQRSFATGPSWAVAAMTGRHGAYLNRSERVHARIKVPICLLYCRRF